MRDTLARLFGVDTTKASIIGLEDGQLPDSPLEKSWDDAALLSTYGDDPWPYLCATKLAENAALAPLQFGIEDGEGEWEWVGPDHPVQSLWDAPNATDDGAAFTALAWTYLEMVGHAPVEVVRPRAGGTRIRPANRAGYELNLVHPGKWRIVANAAGEIIGFVYLAGTTDYRWTPDQMTYLRWPNPNNRWYGQGRLAAVRQALMAEEYADQRDKGLEKRLGVPPGILTSKMPLGEPTALELQRRWEKAVGGYRNSGKIAVLGSETTYQAIAANARDAQWGAQRQARQDVICISFGIPPVLMRMSDATFANAEQARAELWEGTLQPRMSRFAGMVTRKIVPLLTDEPLVARFDFSEVKALNENEQEVVTIAATMANTAAVTVGEVRHRLALEPFGDERDDAVLLPTTIEWSTDRAQAQAQAAELAQRLADAQTQRDANPPQPPENAPGATEDAQAADMPMAEQNARSEPPRRRTYRAPRAKAARRDREQALAPVRSAFASDLRSFFAAQRGALRPIAKAQPIDEDVVQRALEVLGAIRWRERLSRIGRPPIETSQTLGAMEAAAILSVDPSFLVDASEEALASVLHRTTNLPNVVNGTTIAEVEDALRASLAAGEDRTAMNARLDALFDGYEEWRIDRIARTETAYAYAQGAAGQMRDAGVAMVRITDGDGDEVCAGWDGREVPVSEYEADPLGHPNAIIAGTHVQPLGGIEAGYRAEWSGPLIALATAGGARFAIGPNHPVLTGRGWVKASLLNVGDKVIRNGGPVDLHPLNEDLHHVPPTVEQVFDALGASGTSARITAAPTYFHGDGNFCQGKVDVVRPERPLHLTSDPAVLKGIADGDLVMAHMQPADVAGTGARLASGERIDPSTSGGVGLLHMRRVVLGDPHDDSGAPEMVPDGALATADFAADLGCRLAAAVELDEVVHVSVVREWAGHAFDLQTETGAYFADSILVHNCTRDYEPIFDGGDGEPASATTKADVIATALRVAADLASPVKPPVRVVIDRDESGTIIGTHEEPL